MEPKSHNVCSQFSIKTEPIFQLSTFFYDILCEIVFQTCAVYKTLGNAISKATLCCIHETINNLNF